MARLPRYVIPDQPQHVILRGNNRAEIFCCETDYSFYLEKLKLACDKHGCSVHAYVLMTNHVHLLITPHHEQSLGKAMQMLTAVRRVNCRVYSPLGNPPNKKQAKQKTGSGLA
jgi:putative transposase